MTTNQLMTTTHNGNVHDIAERINAASKRGAVQVNGCVVASRYNNPATVYQNGTIGVLVKGKNPGKTITEYVKLGELVQVTY